MEDLKIMSTVECVDCGCVFSVDLDDNEEKCPRCGAKDFKVVDVM